STVKSDGQLELSLAEVEMPEPQADEIVVRIEASPINPSDLGLLLGFADLSTVQADLSEGRPVLTAKVPEAFMRQLAPRLDQSMPVGNEGAGTVVAAGAAATAQGLLGRTVAVLGGAMYAQYRKIKAADALPLPEGTTAREGASCFVNPLTALGMVETLRQEGHSALAHTAAASNLGQMLQKICLVDGVELVNIVRKPEQAALLEGIGARHVCNSSDADFMAALTDAFAETGVTLAFDATGGGSLGSRILTCMEAAAARRGGAVGGYGTDVFKQLYIYGGLDRGPTQLTRNWGFAWSIGGWLLPPFLAKIGPETAQGLRERVAREIKTTFASHYAREVSLAEALSVEAVQAYGRQATGEKHLINPNKGLA
ncbi:MAG: zinc-binding dehydrogenase, partial [Gammaproteobacteria bacterium]|nr:zinc-binding dehydrogenase [Gammaproteobacteria bacterium]